MLQRAQRWVAVLLLCLPSAAGADIASKITAYENEARSIGANLPQVNQLSGAAGQRRLVDAEVAFSLGDYDTAALMLFDLASKAGPDQERATYYLGEALFQKGDRGAARAYYAQVVASNNTSSKYYQPSLLRLIEIAIVQRDNSDVEAHLAALDRLGTTQSSEAPYVKGKYAFSQGKYDEALTLLGQVPKGSEHELQALYYTGVVLVAKKDLGRASEIYTDLINRRPKTSNDRRVIELSQLALGRLYYERDQPSKSIDSYLLVDRRSDLFPDALYEVAWVYVKGKQYDKALRALELLHLSDPTSQKTPTVRILEGNLRIRKAQMIREAQIVGSLDVKDTDPAVEYDKAAQVFSETHDLYLPSYQALEQMTATSSDPAKYLAQIAGRSAGVFQAAAPLPEAAAQYLRDEPEVQRAVSVERDLGEIETNIRQAESTLARLEGVLAANDRTAVYPALQSRRARIGQIQDDLIKLRTQLADQQGGSGETANRRAIEQAYLATPNAEQAHAATIAEAQQQYDALEAASAEVSSTIDSTQAIAVALRKYASDPNAAPPVESAMQATVGETLDTSAKEAAAIEAELADIQRELQLGRDLAGVGDERLAKAREARKQLKAAQDAEHRSLASGGKNGKLIALGDRAARLAESLAQTEARIDSIAEAGIQQAKQLIAQERAGIGALESERATLQAESRSLGGTVLGASFKDVKAKFYDIVIRTDVGSVDVAWAQKEDNDDDLKRLRLSRQRELKSLRDEFKGIIDGGLPTPATPAPSPLSDPSGTPGSPDKGGGPGRITPGSDQPATPATPTVRPDNEQTPKGGQPKGTTPKAGAR